MERQRPRVLIFAFKKEAYINELIKAAASDDPLSRCVAAASSDTPRALLKVLCTDPDPTVRKCVANNQATPPKYAALAMEGKGEETASVVIKFERQKKGYLAMLF